MGNRPGILCRPFETDSGVEASERVVHQRKLEPDRGKLRDQRCDGAGGEQGHAVAGDLEARVARNAPSDHHQDEIAAHETQQDRYRPRTDLEREALKVGEQQGRPGEACRQDPGNRRPQRHRHLRHSAEG